MIKMVTNKRFEEFVNGEFFDRMCDTYITYDKKNKLWLVCDDSTEQKWVEEFKNLDTAIKWLRGEYDL